MVNSNNNVCLLTSDNSKLQKLILTIDNISFPLVAREKVKDYDFENINIILSDFDTLKMLKEYLLSLSNIDYISIIMFVSDSELFRLSELDDLKIKEILFLDTPINKLKIILPNSIRVLSSQNDSLKEKITNLEKQYRNLDALKKVGLSLYEIKDLNIILDLILSKIREVSNADSASIFIIDKNIKNIKGRLIKNNVLKFLYNQNYSFSMDVKEFSIPVSRNSIVGYCAITGNIVNIPDVNKIDDTYDFKYDTKSTNKMFEDDLESVGKLDDINRSVLAIPMKNQKNEVVGVIEIFNKKRDFYQKINSPKVFEEQVIPFDKEDEEIAISLAGQAAISLENNILYKEIKDIFEKFIKAATVAIEARDPTTSGHSERVSKLSREFAIQLNKINEGKYTDFNFSDDEIQAIEYAAILHDFGKIGVREKILSKEKKLYSGELEILKTRYMYLKKAISNDFMKRKLELIKKTDDSIKLAEIETNLDKKLDAKLKEIDNILGVILEVNEPTILKDDKGEILKNLIDKVYETLDGERISYLTENEAKSLLIKKGNLTEEERSEIESHVTHSYDFLSIIPWTKEMKSIPYIAYMHHEQPNGEGYPNKIFDEFIPVQSRIISIADVFDALIARDRPYKKPIPIDKAIDILKNDAKSGKFDPDLVEIFDKYKIYEVIKN